jgi:CPA2 family monovalent cation:H+ antiporter-2
LTLAHRALPGIQKGKVDFAAAPRRALVVTLQIAIVLAVGVPLVAITQPFLPPLRGVLVLVTIVILLGVAFWRSTANLQGHAKAGAEVVASVLAQHLATPGSEREARTRQLDQILPGLGHPVPVLLDAHSSAVGKTLAELNIRSMTGATILAISRDGTAILIPSGQEVLRAGDVVALAGSHEAIAAATQALAAESE